MNMTMIGLTRFVNMIKANNSATAEKEKGDDDKKEDEPWLGLSQYGFKAQISRRVYEI